MSDGSINYGAVSIVLNAEQPIPSLADCSVDNISTVLSIAKSPFGH